MGSPPPGLPIFFASGCGLAGSAGAAAWYGLAVAGRAWGLRGAGKTLERSAWGAGVVRVCGWVAHTHPNYHELQLSHSSTSRDLERT